LTPLLNCRVAITVEPEPSVPLLTRLTERVLVFAPVMAVTGAYATADTTPSRRDDQDVGVEVAAGGGLRLHGTWWPAPKGAVMAQFSDQARLRRPTGYRFASVGWS
jgi:hypothetical protein